MNELKARSAWFYWAVLIGIGLVVGLLVVIIIITRPHQTGSSEEAKVQAEVAKLVILPTDETPALATVTDPSKLKSNRLLSQTKTGDKILIYAKWGQAVVYRPSQNKIVDIGPVNVNPTGSSKDYSPLNENTENRPRGVRLAVTRRGPWAGSSEASCQWAIRSTATATAATARITPGYAM
jgi:hypothetical protein